jgi:O-antigen ligase
MESEKIMNSFGYKDVVAYFNCRSLAVISPLFFLTAHHWTNLVVAILFLGSVQHFYTENKFSLSKMVIDKKWKIIISMALAGPILSVLIGQLLRGETYFPNFDAPLRLAFCIPIFLATCNGWFDRSDTTPISLIWIETIIPLTLLWTLSFRTIWPTPWGTGLTTYFVDPLTFGSYCLLFSLISITGVSFRWSQITWAKRVLGLGAAVAGVYLSLTSGSRTGWVNLPIFLLLWSLMYLKPRFGAKNTALILLGVSIGFVLLVLRENFLVSKFILAWNEIKNYQWNTVNEDTSVGLRISFYRMALHYFAMRPIIGWGDLGWMQYMNDPSIAAYASELARESPKNGFHNEIITSAIRSGVWGLISAVCFFAVFIIKSAKNFYSHGTQHQKLIAFISLIFIIHLLIAGMTTEVLNLVFLNSFIGLTLAIFIAESSPKVRE